MSPRPQSQGGQAVDGDTISVPTASKQGGWGVVHGASSAPTVPDQGEGGLDTSAHADVPIQLGHRAIALPELRLEREVLAFEATMVGASSSCVREQRFPPSGGGRHIEAGELWYEDHDIRSPSARSQGKLAPRWDV